MICLKVNICSQQDLPVLKPACAFVLSWWVFNGFFESFEIDFCHCFPGIDSSAIPRHSPVITAFEITFLGSGIMTTSFQSLGTFFHTWLHNLLSSRSFLFLRFWAAQLVFRRFLMLCHSSFFWLRNTLLLVWFSHHLYPNRLASENYLFRVCIVSQMIIISILWS